MTDHVYADYDGRKQQNVRKALRGSVFCAKTTANAITTLTVDSSGSPGTPTLNALPAGYTDLGFLSDAGAVIGENVNSADINAWGDLEPVRRDITSDVTTLQLVGLETNKQALAAFFSVDPASITADATTGEVSIPKPSTPVAFYWRILVLGVDQNDSGEIYIARFLPNASLTNKGNMSFDSNADAITWDMTFTAYKDSTLGYADKFLAGCPGWKPLKTGMGF
jgi:hypothetical protein